MGHLRLGKLPMRANWQKIIRLLQAGAEADEIAAATQKAADRHLIDAGKNPPAGLVHAFWLLTQIPLAAKGENLSESLRKIGIDVSDQPSLVEIVSSTSEAIDDHIFVNGYRTDIDDLSQRAILSALTKFGADQNLSFLETTPEQTKQKLEKLATTKQFGALSREFFSKFTNQYLSYFLSCELSNHVGTDKRFSNVQEHIAFSDALETYCKETSKIVEDFSGQWYSKKNYEGGITHEEASKFVHVALKKIRSELKRRGGEK